MVWLDHAATEPTRRFIMSEVRGPKFDAYSILKSANGIHWETVINTSGPIVDRSTFFHNPFRNVWGWSIKQSTAAGRVRHYWESPDMFSDTSWTEAGTSPWQQADVDDVHLVPDFTPQIYNLDAWPYESLMIGSFVSAALRLCTLISCACVCAHER